MPTLTDSDGNVILLGDRLAQIDGSGALCVLPLTIGTLFDTSPSSPLYFDHAAHFRSMQVENPDGVISVRFWRSMTSADPVNQVAINKAVTDGTDIPQPDMSNHKWLPLTSIEYGITFSIGISEVPKEVLEEARKSRWLKIDPIYGPFTTANFWPTLSSQ